MSVAQNETGKLLCPQEASSEKIGPRGYMTDFTLDSL